MTPGLQVISESREAETDRSVWKIIILAILGIVASVASVSGFDRLLLGANYLYFWPTIIAFALFLIISILQIVLVKGLYKIAIIAFLESAAPLALFWDKIYPQTSVTLILGAAFAFMFLFAAAKRGRSVLENSIKVRFFGTTKSFLPKIATGFLIFFSLILYLNYFEWGNFSQEMGRRVVAGILMGSEPIVKVIVPAISFQSTVRELLKGLATEELGKTKIAIPGVSSGSPETDFRSLPKQDQEKFIIQATDQLQGIMVSQFGNVNPNEKVSDFAYDLVSKYSSDLSKSSPWILPAIVVLSFFFAIKGILVFLYWLVALLAFLVFKMMIVFGFTYMNLETRSREFILLS
jgi:hypothetical protein